MTQTEQPLQAEGGQDYYTALLQLADETDENGTPQEPRFAVEELMGHLINRTETLSVRDLFAFSDLSRQDAEFVRQEWELIPAPQRRQLLQSLVSIAEEDVDWHLGRFLRMVLGDTDAVVRRLAIEGLWEEVSPDLIGPLVQILHNDDEALVRRRRRYVGQLCAGG
ncbi:MAG: hypothetical protein R2932_08980 [Caldilineaceae bacterium]